MKNLNPEESKNDQAAALRPKCNGDTIETSFEKMQKMCEEIDDMQIEGRNTAGISSLDRTTSENGGRDVSK